jgi:hypothetical protein
MFVPPNCIVEVFNVLKGLSPGLLPWFVNPLFDFSALQVTEERFGYRVVPAVSSSAHAGAKTVFLSPVTELVTPKRDLVRVDDYQTLGPTTPLSHRQRIQKQRGLHLASHAPAHHQP